FPGGDDEIYQFIGDHFHVSRNMINDVGPSAQAMIVSFLVDTTGNISDITFGSPNNVYIENEMIRVIGEMPEWEPGWLDGEKTIVRVYVPIRYFLRDHEFLITTSGTDMVVGNTKKTWWVKILLVGGSIYAFMLFMSKGAPRL
ncbi:MAG: hypothetical protein ABIJ16_01495, partial [Bacteroidota bacterium]